MSTDGLENETPSTVNTQRQNDDENFQNQTDNPYKNWRKHQHPSTVVRIPNSNDKDIEEANTFPRPLDVNLQSTRDNVCNLLFLLELLVLYQQSVLSQNDFF